MGLQRWLLQRWVYYSGLGRFLQVRPKSALVGMADSTTIDQRASMAGLMGSARPLAIGTFSI
jgi:hypothetical protein